jgi:hypothetical protein
MIGELSDKGMSDDGKMIARIDDVPFVCIPKTYPFLEKLERGYQVEYELDEENRIKKIWRAKKAAPQKAGDGFTTAQKMKAAGFTVPNQSSSSPKEVMPEAEVAALKARADEAQRERAHAEEMAAKSKEAKEQPKDKPLESGIKVVQGQITAFDAGAHSLTVKDIDGKHHEMMWKGNLVKKMEKLKQWFFVSISAEKSGDLWVVIDQTYYKKPDNWPVSQKSGYGGKPFVAKNEPAIIMQSSLKVCADVAMFCSAPGGDNFEGMIEMIYTAAKEMTDSIRRDFP